MRGKNINMSKESIKIYKMKLSTKKAMRCEDIDAYLMPNMIDRWE